MTFSQKVRLMPVLAGLTFILVLLINEMTGASNERFLSAIQEGQVPASELSREVETSLVDVQRALHDAVAASDPHGFTEADSIRDHVVAVLVSGRPNPAFPAGEVRGLEEAFVRHYALAREVSGRLIDGELAEPLQPRIATMTAQYTALRERLQASTLHQRTEMWAVLAAARANQRWSVRLVTLTLFAAIVALIVVSSHVIRSTLGSLRAAVAASTAASERLASPRARDGGRSADEVLRLVDSLRETMAALDHSQQRLNAAQRLAHVGSWEWDEHRAQSTWSEELCRIFGIVGAPPSAFAECMTLVHPDDREQIKAVLMKAYSEREPSRFGFRIVRPDGSVRSLLVHNETVTDDGGSVIGLRAAVQDVTESAEAEEALRDGEERYRLLFENNPQPMWVYDRESLRFLAVNNAAVARYGYSHDEFLGMGILDIRPPEDAEAVRRSVDRAPETLDGPTVWRHRRKDGTILQVEVSSHGTRFGSRDARLVLANDVTERSRLEEQLRQTQKMDAIGQLAGGVAHDFNNILGVILGYGEMVQRGLPVGDPLSLKVAEILRAGERAAGLTRQLLTFSRNQVVQPRVLDLNIVVEDMDKMLRRLIGEDVTLKTLPREGLDAVEADPGEMEQVLMNLAVNARDAMPSGGSLIIETQNVSLDESYVRRHAGARPGAHVVLAVSDTGCGMDAATAARIFEPFFTTKPVGKGTGLGLSTVYGIVTKAGGHVQVYSEAGRGTTFKVYLPSLKSAAEVSVSTTARQPPLRGSETILLVEDEPALREMIRDVLEQSGYRVVTSGTPREAIVEAERHAHAIEVVLTDVVMPEMNGPDLVRSLEPLLGRSRAIYMSGYTDDAIGHHGLLDPDVLFLQKPFTSAQLLEKVHEAVAHQPAPVSAPRAAPPSPSRPD